MNIAVRPFIVYRRVRYRLLTVHLISYAAPRTRARRSLRCIPSQVCLNTTRTNNRNTVEHKTIDDSSAMERVPVTVVCGPLGAGKSTLLRYILTQQHGYKIAVIENEFAGSIGVEGMILKDGVNGGPIAEFVELANGCVCCSQRDSLVQTLQMLMARSQKFDAILVETSGLANPGPIASIFWTDVEETASLQLDSVLTVIDAMNFELQMDLASSVGACCEIEDQIAYADTILINKADMVSSDVLTLVEARVRAMSDADTILLSSFGVVPLDRILRRCCYASGSVGRLPSRFADQIAKSVTAHVLPSITTHSHSSGVSAVEIFCDGPVCIEAVERWLGSILWDRELPKDETSNLLLAHSAIADVSSKGILVMRAKGLLYGSRLDDALPVTMLSPQAVGTAVVSSEPKNHWYLLQAVLELFEITPLRGDALLGCSSTGSASCFSRVILIGRGLVQSDLQSSFVEMCKCLPSDPALTQARSPTSST